MNSRLRWSAGLLFALLVGLILAAFLGVISGRTCFVRLSCLLTSALVALLLIVISAFGVWAYLQRKRASEIRELVDVTNQVADGHWPGHVYLEPSSELYYLVLALNRLNQTLGGRIETLRRENQQFSLVLQSMADGVIITDEAGAVVLLNPAARRLLKLKKRKSIGRSYAEVVRHHRLIELWQACRDGAREVVAAAEIRNLFVQAYVSPFQQAETPGFLIILQDLTQVHFLQTVRRDFISNISHELRTPLAAIRAVVETLQDGALDEPPLAHSYLDRAEGELDAMTQIVDELLELARIESGQVPLSLVPTAMADLVAASVSRLQSHAARNGIEITTAVSPDLPLVMSDPDRMGQVIVNILHNAIKFTPEGGHISVQARQKAADNRRPDEVVVSVKDNGEGIAKQDLPRVFERFYKSGRAKIAGQSGTGLGLAISKHIVEMHGGRIWVKSKIHKGSTFFFALPTSA